MLWVPIIIWDYTFQLYNWYNICDNVSSEFSFKERRILPWLDLGDKKIRLHFDQNPCIMLIQHTSHTCIISFTPHSILKVKQAACSGLHAQEGPELDVMLCSCCPEIPNNFKTRDNTFSFCAGPYKLCSWSCKGVLGCWLFNFLTYTGIIWVLTSSNLLLYICFVQFSARILHCTI